MIKAVIVKLVQVKQNKRLLNVNKAYHLFIHSFISSNSFIPISVMDPLSLYRNTLQINSVTDLSTGTRWEGTKDPRGK